MNNNVKTIGIIGAGTAGLIAAIILKIRLNVDVNIIHSTKIGIIGVGEGSTEHWNEFMHFAKITQTDIIKECDATYKSGIMFDGWSSNQTHKYMHSIMPDFLGKKGIYSHIFAELILLNEKLNPKELFENHLDVAQIDYRENAFPFNQYHFNTHKLNDFLIKIAQQHDIKIIEDEIEDVTLNEDGSIKKVKGEKAEYSYDFYIDSTGFKRILMTKLGAKWNSFSKYLKLNSAFVFQTEDEDNYNVWTLAKAMNSGWMFRIPVWGRYGNGYIYDSNHISKENALQEVENYFGKKLNVGKEFSFDAGCLDRVWIKNCCAIGLSGSFIEPLEATSIGTSIQQSFILANTLASYSQNEIDQYNRKFNVIMSNIRDYVLLHYLTDRKDTEFWKEVTSVELPDTLASLLEMWKNRLPNKEDIIETYPSSYCMFWDANFTQILYGINYFDKGSIKNELNSYSNHYNNHELIRKITSYPKITIPHKTLIKVIRES